jgi:hypothetical protein
MSTLSDLRSTLGEHAERVPDGEGVARAAAVHHRVRVARRRRRAVGASALALVVATVVGLVGVQRASSTPPPVVFGVRAPETLTALGYTYRSDGQAATFARQGSLKISASSTPRLFSWTTDRPAPVRMILPNGETWTSHQTRFTDFVQIPAGESGTLRVWVPSGSVGLASYVRTDAAPAGFTKDGSTYRQSVDGAPLLAAAISDPGQTEVTTTYVATGRRVVLRVACSGVPKGYVVNVSLNGDGPLSSGGAGACASDDWIDPGAASYSELPDRRAGTTVRVRLWVSTGFHSDQALPASSVPALRIGAGVYGPSVTRPVGGYRLPSVVEQDGHTWRMASVVESAGSSVRVDPAGYDRLAGMAWNVHGRTRVQFRSGPTSPEEFGGTGGKAATGSLWVAAGRAAHGRILQGSGTLGVALYERAD